MKSTIIEHKNSRKPRCIEVDGVFVVIGVAPMTEIVKKAEINVDEGGCIIVDRSQSTNVKGVYAAGDCTCGGMQIVTTVGEGAVAVMQAYRYVRQKKNNYNRFKFQILIVKCFFISVSFFDS